MLLQHAWQNLSRNSRGGERKRRERETLISVQLKADRQIGVQRKSTEPNCEPRLQSSKRQPFLTPFASNGATAVFIQGRSSAQRSEWQSAKWKCGTFIFKCNWFNLQTTKGGLNGVWKYDANNPFGLSDTEIKYGRTGMGGCNVIIQSGRVTSVGKFWKLSLLRQQLCYMPGHCSSQYNSQLLHCSQAQGGHANQ